ncbi:MAG TPA: hypothetical protein PLN85_00135 [archaeon]|nr:hypothetical protein [archaeon]
MKIILNYFKRINDNRKRRNNVKKFLEYYKDGMTKQKYRLLFKSFMKITYINDFFNKKDNKIILPTNETINKIISIINEHTEKQYSYENIEKLKKINEKLSLDINKYIEENNKLEEKLKIIKKNV